MKKYFEGIAKFSQPGQNIKLKKRLAAILVCFLIASVFWLLIALSKEYETSVSFPVMYTDFPGQKVVVNDLPASIALRVKTSGFKIIAFHFSKNNVPVQLNVASRVGTSFEQGGEAVVVPAKNFEADFSAQLGSEISILDFTPDSIAFNFSYKSIKKVAVKADLHITLDKQFGQVGDPQIFPDSVNITGPESRVNSINYISTEPVTIDQVKETIVKQVSLRPNKGIVLSDTLVKLTVPVEKFTEQSLEIPIVPVHVKKGFAVKTFPEKVKIKFRVPFSKYTNVSENSFAAVADAGKPADTKLNKLNVEIITSPPFVRSIVVEPQMVDYILVRQ